jgi:hypothetical protein
MLGIIGPAPMAKVHFRNFKTYPFTSTSLGLKNLAQPKKTSQPKCFEKRSAESMSDIYDLILLILSITASKSTSISPFIFIPYYLACFIIPATFAEAKKVLEGIQPVYKQSPPNRPFSIKATFAPKPADPAAVTSPPAPPPITTISYIS